MKKESSKRKNYLIMLYAKWVPFSLVLKESFFSLSEEIGIETIFVNIDDIIVKQNNKKGDYYFNKDIIEGNHFLNIFFKEKLEKSFTVPFIVLAQVEDENILKKEKTIIPSGSLLKNNKEIRDFFSRS